MQEVWRGCGPSRILTKAGGWWTDWPGEWTGWWTGASGRVDLGREGWTARGPGPGSGYQKRSRRSPVRPHIRWAGGRLRRVSGQVGGLVLDLKKWPAGPGSCSAGGQDRGSNPPRVKALVPGGAYTLRIGDCSGDMGPAPGAAIAPPPHSFSRQPNPRPALALQDGPPASRSGMILTIRPCGVRRSITKLERLHRPSSSHHRESPGWSQATSATIHEYRGPPLPPPSSAKVRRESRR